MAAHEAPPSLGFSRQEHWRGLPFPSPMHESESDSEVAQSCPTLSDPMDCSLPGSSVHGIFQARVLEWGAIAFSDSNATSCLKNHFLCFYRLKVWVPFKFIYWKLMPKVTLFGAEAFGSWLSHEGEVLMNGISALIIETQETPSTLLPCEIQWEDGYLWARF